MSPARNRNGIGFVAVFVFAMFLLAGNACWAHRLVPDNGAHVNAQTAIPIEDINVSQVAYHEVTAESPQLWFTFNGKAGQTLNIQMGVPKIDRLKDYRPALAVLGPGLPEVALPFDVPPGCGGRLFITTDIAEPAVFNEEFTGTTSWQFPQQDYVLPADGRYYVVAYAPSGAPGKLWLAVGTAESFSLGDILGLPQTVLTVRSFHEVGPIGGLAELFMLLLVLLGMALSLLFLLL